MTSVTMADLVSSLGFFLLGAYFQARARRPKLVIAGGSSGGSATGAQCASVYVKNEPFHMIGVSVEREVARVVTAILIDEKTGRNHLLSKNWQENGAQQVSCEARIATGEGNYLNVVQFPSTGGAYYLCGENAAVIEDSATSFDDKARVFTLRLVDSLERQYRLKFRVSPSPGTNHWHVVPALNSQMRKMLFKDGASQILRSLRPSRFTKGPNW